MSDPQEHAWIEEIHAAVTVTDADGVIIAMNRRACETFAADGGAALVGRSVFDCHPQRARAVAQALYESGQPNHYTISKKGQRKIVHQMPWHQDGRFAGFVEISVPIPDTLPHFDRG